MILRFTIGVSWHFVTYGFISLLFLLFSFNLLAIGFIECNERFGQVLRDSWCLWLYSSLFLLSSFNLLAKHYLSFYQSCYSKRCSCSQRADKHNADCACPGIDTGDLTFKIAKNKKTDKRNNDGYF
jgi:hypothetical protein